MALCAYGHSQNLSNFILKSRSIGNDHVRRRTDSMMVKMVSSSSSTGAKAYEEGQLQMPKWAGETPLSRLVQSIIAFKPLYSFLKLGARQVLIRTAEKKDIPWRELTREVLESDVYKELESVQNSSVIYPDYYLNSFHAYDEGNLSWLAAAEAEPATMAMVRRAIPDASSLDEANRAMRGNWLQTIEQHHLQHSGNHVIKDILDVGCSVGISTRFLADKFPNAKVTGLDLSPYFLAVAQFKEKKVAPRQNPIKWIHANGEETGLPSKSFDLVSFAAVVDHYGARYMVTSVTCFHKQKLHECPERAIVGLLKEAFRVLRPGGTIALTDQAPKSKILQELSPVLFTLLKSTEPFLDEYYLTDLEGRLKEIGFVNIGNVLTDPRHMTVTATVPR